MAKKKNQPRTAAWKESEFFHFEKGTLWYTIFIIAMIVVAAISAWFRNWLLAGVMMAATFAMITFAKEKPAERQFRIDGSGVQVGNRKYRYEELKGFWVTTTPEGNLLYLQSIKRFSQPVMINLGNYQITRIRKVLSPHLPEEPRSEMLSDRINRWLRF